MPVTPRSQLTAQAVLKRIPLFAGMSGAGWDKLAAASRVIELPGHSALFAIGQPIHALHYLVSGSIKRFAQRADAIEKVLELVKPGHLFALSEAFAGTAYASCAKTLEASVVLAIPLDALNALLKADAELAQRLLQALAQQHYAVEFDVVRHHSLSVTQRVLDYLLSLAGDARDMAGESTVALGASKRLIAAQLDMAPETFSRTLRQLSDDGVIVVNGRTVHIQNAPLMRQAESAEAKPVRYLRHERGADSVPPGWPEIVNLCARHRMLSQRLATAWVMAQRGLNAQAARVTLRKLREEFARNLQRVQSLDLPATLHAPLAALAKEWIDCLAVLGAGDAADPAHAFACSEAILECADALAQAAVAAAGSEEAQRVNLAGRNRMHSARMVKLFLFYDWSVEREQSATRMDSADAEFRANLEKLRTYVAGTPHALAQLDIDAAHWQGFMKQLGEARSGASNRQRTLAICAAGDELLRHADSTVKIYEQLSALQAQA